MAMSKCRSRHPPRWRPFSLILLSLLALCLQSRFVYGKDEPEVSETKFESLPKEMFYFSGSQTVLFHDRDRNIVWRSSDGGAKWKEIDDVPKERLFMWQHPFDNQRAYLLTGGRKHYRTEDQGKSWQDFETPTLITRFGEPLAFHADDSKKIILNAMECQADSLLCSELAYVTFDEFKTTKLLRKSTRGCYFAKCTALIETGKDTTDADRVICIATGRYSSWKKDNRLLISDDYFKKDEFEPAMNKGRTVAGVLNLVAAKKYVIVAAKSADSSEMALYVSKNGRDFKRALFPHDHKIEEEAYTILESTNYSIQVDVMSSRYTQPMGVLFSSDSDGVDYTRLIEGTHRNRHGFTDFEKVQGIQGIALVNVVANHKDVEDDPFLQEIIQSRITFDDGRSFMNITAENEKQIHLHSVTDLSNSGRIFSSPAPGVIMGVGNTGDKLLAYDEGDLYVSDDAGISWFKALDGAHKYEFGDQGSILVAVYDEEPTDKLMYSTTHGKGKWKEVSLGRKVKARLLTTSPDSSSLKFLLVGTSGSGSQIEHWTFSIDFSDLHERTCEDKDFEEWCARKDEDGNCDCLMGHKQYYHRRKADADCFIKKQGTDATLSVRTEQCACTDEDFECDVGYLKSTKGKCEPVDEGLIPHGACKGDGGTFKGSSGYRLIPGNDCDKSKGSKKDEEKEWPCKGVVSAPSSGDISSKITEFDATSIQEMYYLERPELSQATDETIVLRTDSQEIYVTHDHGKSWKTILDKKNIVGIIPHRFNHDHVFFVTASKEVHYSIDRATKHFGHFDAPYEPKPTQSHLMSFHPVEKDWIIWLGQKDCGRDDKNCHTVAEISTNRGDDWKSLRKYVKKCQFVYHEQFRGDKEKLIYCEQFENEDVSKPLQLVTSMDFFQTADVKFPDIRDFATMSEFIVVAAENRTGNSLKVDCSVDGNIFADAQFPRDFQVDIQKAYTVLDSSTHSIFLHVTTNVLPEHEFGSIIKSNSNGTSYALSINYVNRNFKGYVDFEKTLGMEGVAVVNVVANPEEAQKGGAKKLKTKITHNDGADWAFIQPPAKDVDGKEFGCSGKNLEECSLHIHGYTERDDPTDTYSSPSAIGVMIGVGNVGEYLDRPNTGDTFISVDGGVNWKQAMKGSYMWEFGDQGSVIVLVSKDTPTKSIFYTTDQGEKWTEWAFAKEDVEVGDITTVPSDTSMNFLLWGKRVGRGGSVLTINIDFSGLFDKACKLNEDDPTADDYDLWTPEHPLMGGKCLFGHVAKYHRKKPGKMCYNGLNKVNSHIHDMSQSCECERHDFECDYDYERRPDGSCKLVDGAPPPNHEDKCALNSSLVSWFEPTGYRRIPGDTCKGGKEYELNSKEHSCPGHEKEFNEKHRMGGFALFSVIVIPIALAAGAGYWVWRNWDGKFGRIRLGDTPGSQTWEGALQILVLAIAGTWAIISLVPDVVGRLWNWARGGRRYTSRSAFQRARGEYEVVTRMEEEDVGGLLGDDSDEE